MKDKPQVYLPLVCFVILAAVFANAFHHHFTGLPRFAYLIREWGIDDMTTTRRLARAVVVFEFFCAASFTAVVAVKIGGQATRFDYAATRGARLCAFAAIILFQLVTVWYLTERPAYTASGSLTLRIDGWIEELWMLLGVARPESSYAVPVIRNILLTLVAVGALRMKKAKRE